MCTAYLNTGVASQFLLNAKYVVWAHAETLVPFYWLRRDLTMARRYFKEQFGCDVEDFLKFNRFSEAIFYVESGIAGHVLAEMDDTEGQEYDFLRRLN